MKARVFPLFFFFSQIAKVAESALIRFRDDHEVISLLLLHRSCIPVLRGLDPRSTHRIEWYPLRDKSKKHPPLFFSLVIVGPHISSRHIRVRIIYIHTYTHISRRQRRDAHAEHRYDVIYTSRALYFMGRRYDQR